MVGNRHKRNGRRGGRLLLPSVLGRGPLEWVARSRSVLASYTNRLEKPFRSWDGRKSRYDVEPNCREGHLTLEVLATSRTKILLEFTLAIPSLPFSVSHSSFLLGTCGSRRYRGVLGVLVVCRHDPKRLNAYRWPMTDG